MKKFLTLFVIILISFSSFISPSLALKLDDNNGKNIEKLYSYIDKIDNLVDKISLEKAKKIKTKIDNFKFDNIKDKTTLLVLKYLKIKIENKIYKTNFSSEKSISDSETKNINKNLTVTIIGDKRMPLPKGMKLEDFAKQFQEGLPSLKTANIISKDFKDEGVKDFMEKNKIIYLPTIIYSTKEFDDSTDAQSVKGFLEKLPNGEFSLYIGGQFDPMEEICDNGIDDNEDGKIDCEDSKCSKELSCAEKVDRPKAELFVMSYCPYGTQAEKGFLEAMLKLDEVADMKIRFVSYLMHGEKEGEENLAQYCIQKEQNNKYKDYLKCFLKKGKNKECLKEIKIDETKLSSCVETTKISINYDANIKDKSNRFPLFELDREDNKKYGVQGSPTFVLNGVKVEKIGRSAKSYADAICSTFKEKPAVCDEEFSNTTYDPMFGFISNGRKINGACGGQ